MAFAPAAAAPATVPVQDQSSDQAVPDSFLSGAKEAQFHLSFLKRDSPGASDALHTIEIQSIEGGYQSSSGRRATGQVIIIVHRDISPVGDSGQRAIVQACHRCTDKTASQVTEVHIHELQPQPALLHCLAEKTFNWP